MKDLEPIFLKVKEMDKGAGAGVVDFLQKLEVYVSYDSH
jgi:hypothetical protein